MCSSFVYLVSPHKHGFVWAGITTDLVSQIWQHKQGDVPGQSALHNCTRLVWHTAYSTPEEAESELARLSRWPDAWKARLIEKTNPDWTDLWASLESQPSIGISPAFGRSHPAPNASYPVIRPMLKTA